MWILVYILVTLITVLVYLMNRKRSKGKGNGQVKDRVTDTYNKKKKIKNEDIRNINATQKLKEKNPHHRQRNEQQRNDQQRNGRQKNEEPEKSKINNSMITNINEEDVDIGSSPVNENNAIHKTLKKGLLPSHISFERNVVHLKSGKAYALSICINKAHSLICMACSDDSLQFHKIFLDKENKNKINEIKTIHRMDEIYECIDINDDGNILVAIEESTTTLRVFDLLYNSNGTVRKINLLFKGQKQIYDGHVKFVSLHNKSYIVTGSEKEETEVKVWNLKGELLHVLSIKKISNQDYAHSTSGKLLSIACWSSGVHIYEFCMKEGNLQKVKKVMDVPTQSGTNCLCFSHDEKTVYIIDKKGTLNVYNINVRYQQQEDPKFINKIDLNKLVNITDFSKLACTGDSLRLVAVSEKKLYIMDSLNFKLLTVIEAHTHDIIGVLPVPDSSFIVTWAYDGCVRLWDLSKVPI